MIEINRRPSATDLRAFGAILPVFFGAVGAALRWRFGHADAGLGVWAAGAVAAGVYAAIRPLRLPMYLAWMNLFFPLGWVVSHAVLVVVFFGVVTPVALAMRLVRYDPMKRRLEPSAPTYWTGRRPTGDVARYLRQY
jgi:hypothetical protein